MNAKLIGLSQRRAALIAQAASERDALSYCYHRFDEPVRLVEKAIDVLKFLKSPIVVTSLVALLVNMRWRNVAQFSRLITKAWQIWSAFSQFKK